MRFRRCSLWTVSLVVLAGCDALTGPDTPRPPALPVSVAAAYQEDAAQLALRDVARQQPIREAPVDLPSATVSGYANALAWLYHSSGAARDSVVEEFVIHGRPSAELHEVLLTIDDTHAWTSTWRQLQPLTGDPGVDYLVVKYQLQVLSWHSTAPSGASVLLTTPLTVNAAALGRTFEAIPGVQGGYPNVKGGEGDDIRGEREDGAWLLTFSRAWGDCALACLYHHNWRFRVSPDGDVRFLGSDGPAVPSGSAS